MAFCLRSSIREMALGLEKLSNLAQDHGSNINRAAEAV